MFCFPRNLSAIMLCIFTFSIPQRAQWTYPPIVINCYDSPFTTEEVEHVVEKWQNRGHQFAGVMDGNCLNQEYNGFIYITAASQNFSLPSEEYIRVRYESDTKNIHLVIIEVFKDDLLYLEHEIGHALGYEHTSKKWHIMYQNSLGIGFDDKGLYKE